MNSATKLAADLVARVEDLESRLMDRKEGCRHRVLALSQYSDPKKEPAVYECAACCWKFEVKPSEHV